MNMSISNKMKYEGIRGRRNLERWQIRERDANGNLTEAGFIWFERRPFVAVTQTLGALALLVAACVYLYRAIMYGGDNIPVFVVLAALYAFFFFVLSKYQLRQRQIVFTKSGEIWFSHGFPLGGRRDKEPDLTLVANAFDELVSVEVRKDQADFAVLLVFRTGEELPVTVFQNIESEARIIATQITQSAEAIRQAQDTNLTPEDALRWAQSSAGKDGSFYID